MVGGVWSSLCWSNQLGLLSYERSDCHHCRHEHQSHAGTIWRSRLTGAETPTPVLGLAHTWGLTTVEGGRTLVGAYPLELVQWTYHQRWTDNPWLKLLFEFLPQNRNVPILYRGIPIFTTGPSRTSTCSTCVVQWVTDTPEPLESRLPVERKGVKYVNFRLKSLTKLKLR